MRRYMVCMIPFDLTDYQGYTFLGVYADDSCAASDIAERVLPTHWVDDIVAAHNFAHFYPNAFPISR